MEQGVMFQGRRRITMLLGVKMLGLVALLLTLVLLVLFLVTVLYAVALIAFAATGIGVEWVPLPFILLLALKWTLMDDRVRRGKREVKGSEALQREDVRGWKAANLELEEGEIVFGGLVHGTYQGDDKAKCLHKNHAAPEVECTCGFYAFFERGAARRARARRMASCLLEVDLYGTIIEHRRGWRAEEQVVLACYVHQKCTVCFKKASVVGKTQALNELLPLCERCGRDTESAVHTLTELSEALKVEVHWADWDSRRELLSGLNWRWRRWRGQGPILKP